MKSFKLIINYLRCFYSLSLDYFKQIKFVTLILVHCSDYHYTHSSIFTFSAFHTNIIKNLHFKSVHNELIYTVLFEFFYIIIDFAANMLVSAGNNGNTWCLPYISLSRRKSSSVQIPRDRLEKSGDFVQRYNILHFSNPIVDVERTSWDDGMDFCDTC